MRSFVHLEKPPWPYTYHVHGSNKLQLQQKKIEYTYIISVGTHFNVYLIDVILIEFLQKLTIRYKSPKEKKRLKRKTQMKKKIVLFYTVINKISRYCNEKKRNRRKLLLFNVKSKFNLKIVKTRINGLKIEQINGSNGLSEKKKINLIEFSDLVYRRMSYLRSYSSRSCYNNNHRLKNFCRKNFLLAWIKCALCVWLFSIYLEIFLGNRKCVSHVVTKNYWYLQVTRRK